MDVSTAIHERRSCRAFRPDPVPDEVVRELLETARWAPSWGNAQDWNVWVVSGDTFAELRSKLHNAAHIGKTSRPDVPMPHGEWPDDYRRRMDIPVRRRFGNEAEEADTPTPVHENPFHFYGAPCLLLLALDHRLVETYACLDAGLYVQTLCLAAEEQGLGTCIVAMAMRHPELLHRLLPGTFGKHFVLGVALGYPDQGAEERPRARARVPIDEYVRWVR